MKHFCIHLQKKELLQAPTNMLCLHMSPYTVLIVSCRSDQYTVNNIIWSLLVYVALSQYYKPKLLLLFCHFYNILF